MSEINREKVSTAVRRVCETFEELNLTMEERAIVSYSTYKAAQRFKTQEELTQRTREQPQKIPKIQIYAAVVGTGAVILSTISIFVTLLR